MKQYNTTRWGTRHGQPGVAQAGYLVLSGGSSGGGVAWRGGGEGSGGEGERAKWSEGEVGRRGGGGERGRRREM